MERYIKTLAGVSAVEFLPQDAPAPRGAVSAVCEAAVVYLPLGELVDIAQETARAEKEHAALLRDIASLEGKLGNAGFISKAPAAVVESERQRLAVLQDKAQKLRERIDGLKELN
jgi:valyl-tRNA synthetase